MHCAPQPVRCVQCPPCCKRRGSRESPSHCCVNWARLHLRPSKLNLQRRSQQLNFPFPSQPHSPSTSFALPFDCSFFSNQKAPAPLGRDFVANSLSCSSRSSRFYFLLCGEASTVPLPNLQLRHPKPSLSLSIILNKASQCPTQETRLPTPLCRESGITPLAVSTARWSFLRM